MSDLITLDGLELWPHLGWPEEERAQPQLVRVTVVMHVTPVTPAARHADLALTVNYYDVAQGIKALATAQPRRLIETLAEDCAAYVLENFPVQQVTVEIEKYILPDTRAVRLKITRPLTNVT